MSPIIVNTIVGALKILKVPERECFKSWSEFINSIPDFVGVEVPATVNGVIFSRSEPGDDFKDSLWVYRDSAGNVLGLYAWQGTSWKPLYTMPKYQVFWFWGDSDNPPAGFTAILTGDTEIPSGVVSALVSQYVVTTPNRYAYYAARYTGF